MMQIELPIAAEPASGNRLNKLTRQFGQDRGEALSRLSEGLRTEGDTRRDDLELILSALADAIILAPVSQ